MSEREAFEAWARSVGKDNRDLEWRRDHYTWRTEQQMWEAWQAARAQPAQAVPMTDEQVLAEFARAHPQDHTDMQDGSHTNAVERIGARAVYRRFERGIRAAEKFHGIVGKEGA